MEGVSMVGILVAASAFLARSLVSGKLNGCWMPSVYDFVLPDCTPQPPTDLCSKCPLIVENVVAEGELKGHFMDCTAMYHIETGDCQEALQ